MRGVVSQFVQAGVQHSVGQREAFPERPGQPDCQYYKKTGDCKLGTTCRCHHPKERIAHSPACMLSPMGLPLRPDQPACPFYARYGICKFGPTCKFDHPPLVAQEQVWSSNGSPRANLVGAGIFSPM
ncbi:zinc finger CCCH domain-containing protein ZFN-like [Cryptomeria japonica]|uniref:zinc finger CCCH domain-containing protein ZFN-like n=1 Tax=Cryptomeria japonica TaxID=3369 RepID=UPI0027D9E9EF|nr:zinc finger CCCH domain-containing protein ZFN-like [Cryptomeria japonica]XP_057857102.2 zinc finger CCCH domain-containing protein ZFN-like [Cryptomeria japonica]XP_057857103.2 zinc finger CCCH domain-containing protein ZFN-like [Cryptomeria japonica]